MSTSVAGSGVGLSFAAYISDISAHHTKFQSLTLPNPADEDHGYPQLPIAELAVLIHKLWIRGPCFTVPPSTHIGSGAQFVVRQGSIGFFNNPSAGLRTVALKTPKFVLDAKDRLDLSESAVRRQVRDFLIEIAALRHPRLRRHENIVNIIGWGIDDDNWHRTPFIALELADDDLAGILSTKKDIISIQTKFDIIKDLAAALDAIHEIGLIHGDLKPENILVFKRGPRWTAKLSDFGSGADLSKGGQLAGRGTIGWRAPELRRYYEEGESIDPLLLDRLDAYSFGLVTWALICEFTTSPPDGEEDALDTALTHVRNREDMTSEFALVLENLLQLCLCGNAQCRPQWILPLLVEEDENEETVEFSPDLSELVFDDTYVEFEDEDEVSSTNSSILSSDYEHWNWELPDLEVELLHPLMFAFLEDEGSLSPETAFAVFLKWVEGGPGPTDEPTASAPWARLLHAAAVGGVQQARALIFRYYEFHGYEINEDIRSKVLDWNLESIATGALAFSSEVRTMDGPGFDAALRLFQESGGFNQHYSGMSPQILQEYLSSSIPLSSKSLSEPLNRSGDCLPHILASFNHPEAIDTLKTIMTRECVDMRNKFGETPLYRACECGASETVIFLLEMGANPSLRPRRKGPSCLHWLFAFHPDHVDLIATKLIEKGASTNILTNQRQKMFHYPFMLPAGSPLHWAVRFGCPEAIRALLRHGADPFLRDSDRQFIFLSSDPDIRPDSPDDIPHEEFILGPSAGSSAVDLAVQNWNPDILEILLESRPGVPAETATDGIGVPHHLVAGDFCWISDCSPSRFYTPYVRGSAQTQRANLERTLRLLRRHSFDIDSPAPAWPSGKTSTALMLAIHGGKIDLAELLLAAGADPNAADSHGRTALMYMGVRYGVEYSGSQTGQEEIQRRATTLLLAHGAEFRVRDRAGYSPVLVLASHYLRAATRTLLDRGAAADDRVLYADANRDDVVDFPIFGHLAWALSDKLDDDRESATRAHDEELAAMLRRYVVPLVAMRCDEPDDGVGYRELERHVLLHELAICGLTESVAVVLCAGADVNPVTKRPGKPARTPLDAVLNFIGLYAGKGGRGMSKAEAEKRDRRYEGTVALLRRYGALRACELEARRGRDEE